jgi:hypothetical protein
MTAKRRSDIQRAIDFLSGKLGAIDPAALPPKPDYEALARYAGQLGHDLPPAALAEAFRLMMRARLLP